jgi:hypothetical protein
LLCLALPAFSAAQTDPSTSPRKPASAAHTARSKPSTATVASGKRASAQGVPVRKRRKSTARKVSRQTEKKRGQQAIDSDRAREIQAALIREHYMDGEPSGTWDSATQAAMQRYQADQGWQSKTTPDSRALIKLGLGPSHDHLLNPESAMTTTAPVASATPKADAKPAPTNKDVPQQK